MAAECLQWQEQRLSEGSTVQSHGREAPSYIEILSRDAGSKQGSNARAINGNATAQ